jgi:mannitol/fructose-specific phosphotransferase system IIA component
LTYTVKSSERLRKPGAEMETKALLYLMNFRKDSDEIHYFVVDFFNDITGMDRTSAKLWDIQSKGASNSSPKAIGKELVTLYKNYLSDFVFNYLILFLGGVSDSLRIDSSINIFGTENIKQEAIKKIKEGLVEEGKVKTYIDNTQLTDSSINDFLGNIIFVVDVLSPAEYVKSIIKDHPKIIPEDNVLNAIFNEIRDVQSSKKNAHVVEGVVISTSDEALNYYRHLTNNEIRLMTLQRIINRDPVAKGVPFSFMPILQQCPPEDQRDMIDECKTSLCRALFNKNVAQNFWTIFENIYYLVVKNPTEDVQHLFRKVDTALITACPDFDALSVKYFISVVKDGIQS